MQRAGVALTTLGSYQVTAKIGEGGMGEVFRTRDTKLDGQVALNRLWTYKTRVCVSRFPPSTATTSADGAASVSIPESRQ